MVCHVCPWWGGYFIDNRFRRLLHKPEIILAPYVRDGMTAMDIGCGMGFFSIAMAKMVGDAGRVIAVDVQQKMLDVLQERARKAGVADRIRTHRCEPDLLGIDETVDFALAFYAAHEVPDLRRLLSQTHGCLGPNGKFLVTEPRFHVWARTFDRMIETGEDIGLRMLETPRVCLSRSVVFGR